MRNIRWLDCDWLWLPPTDRPRPAGDMTSRKCRGTDHQPRRLSDSVETISMGLDYGYLTGGAALLCYFYSVAETSRRVSSGIRMNNGHVAAVYEISTKHNGHPFFYILLLLLHHLLCLVLERATSHAERMVSKDLTKDTTTTTRCCRRRKSRNDKCLPSSDCRCDAIAVIKICFVILHRHNKSCRCVSS